MPFDIFNTRFGNSADALPGYLAVPSSLQRLARNAVQARPFCDVPTQFFWGAHVVVLPLTLPSIDVVRGLFLLSRDCFFF